jgi:phosphate transport system substrate-binding protein
MSIHPAYRAHAAFVGLALMACLASPAVQAQTTIKVDGSMGSMPLVQALAKAHQTERPGLAIEFGKGLNPKARVEALAAGGVDIALASHGVDANALNRQGMQVTEIARTAVVFAANASVGVDNLKDEQICAMLAGRVANWRDVGGPDLAVAARARPESEVDTEVIRDGVSCLKGQAFAPAVKIVQRGSEMTKELAETSGAIGMTTTTVVEQSGGKIRAIALNGVVANEANVASGKYGIVRETFVIVKGGANPAVNQFVAFMRSPAGAAIIKANGALPTVPRPE